jgi:hypothetical protein
VKVEWEEGRLVVRPSDAELAERKRQAFIECGHETIEELLRVLRARGVGVPLTAYEKAVERVERAASRRGGKVTTGASGE